MTDPGFYSKPVTVTKKWLAVEGGKLLPYDCTEPQWEDLLDKLRQEKAAAAPKSRDAPRLNPIQSIFRTHHMTFIKRFSPRCCPVAGAGHTGVRAPLRRAVQFPDAQEPSKAW